MFRRLLPALAPLVLLISCSQWKVAEGPLTTRWAKEVNPRAPLPEYPRPQLVRKKWRNLNGLWQFKVARKDESPPINRELEGRILVPFPVES